MSQQDAKQSRTLRILVADDVWATIHGIRLMLKLLPDVEVVATARDGREAIELTRQCEPDIALVDINMPHANGFAAIKEMLDIRPELVCVIMSVEGHEIALREAKEHGASDFLVKPFTTEELVAVVERASQLLVNRRPTDEGTALLRRRLTAPLRMGQTSYLREEREGDLKQLASEYIKSRRTDDEAIGVLEELAASPYCEIHWLKWLAVIYVKRMHWKKLRVLTERLEAHPQQANLETRMT